MTDTIERTSYKKRAKALLGTLLELTVPSMPEKQFVHITDRIFARIVAIQAAMSFHEHDSDIRQLCRANAGDVCTIAHDTWHVLTAALDFEHASNGIFNLTIAPALVSNSRLPNPVNRAPPAIATLAESIVLRDDNAVEILRPFWLDVGGIAKGYAVDAAIQTLHDCGVIDCIVNAGGDLRVAGKASHLLALRNPQLPAQSFEIANINNLACATSAAYFTDAKIQSLAVHPDIIGVQAANNNITSATVIATNCMTADALTKILWLRGSAAKSLLGQYNAEGVLILNTGEICRV
jgi:FAD:protein FMN transferase